MSDTEQLAEMLSLWNCLSNEERAAFLCLVRRIVEKKQIEGLDPAYTLQSKRREPKPSPEV